MRVWPLAAGLQEQVANHRKRRRYLRSALVEAAHVIPIMKKTRFNIFFRKRMVRAGYQKAIVATAHKILQVVYYVLKNQTPYQEEYSAGA